MKWRNNFKHLTWGLLGASLIAQVSVAAPSQFTQNRIQIDRIELTGVSVFEGAQIESALEVNIGDLLDRTHIIHTEERIQNLYRLHGYEQTQVKTDLFRKKNDAGKVENIVEFTIREGDPTRIAAVHLSVTNQLDAGFQKYWLLNRKSLETKVGLVPSDIFNQEVLAAGKRNLQDTLASAEFIGARVVGVNVDPVDKPSSAKLNAARWVELEVQVDLGDRVTFGFRGNSIFTKAKLDSVVEEQRLVGFGKDYLGTIRNRVEEEYRAVGYSKVKVVPFTFEHPHKQERHVTFDINEGPRIKISSVEFDGNVAFTGEILKHEFYGRASLLIQKQVFVEKEVEKASELVVEWMKSLGFLAAKLVTVKYVYDGTEVKMVVYLYEGDQTIIQRVHLSGVQAFSRSEIYRFLSIQENAPLNLFAFSEGLETLKTAYHARGYLDARIVNEGTDTVVNYMQENRAAELFLDVAEGPQYRTSRIEIEGLSGTHDKIIRRQLTFHEGDVLEEPKITESEARIRKLLIFSLVNIRFIDDPEKPGFKIVRVTLQEGTPGLVAGGLGYRNDLGVRVFGQYDYTNLWNENHTVSLNLNLNRRFDEDFCAHRKQKATTDIQIGSGACFIEYQAQVAYIWPWFLINELKFTPKLTFEKTQFRDLDARILSAAAIWERPLLQRPLLIGSFTASLEQTQYYNALYIADKQSLRIGAITPSLRLDMRDNILAPTKGLFAAASFEFASPAFLSQSRPVEVATGDNTPTPVGYTRFQFRSDYFIPIAKEVTGFLSFRSGFEANTQKPPAGLTSQDIGYRIPPHKLFTLGGASSLRGFSEQEINAGDFAIRGTLAYVTYRAQLDLPFSGPLRFGPFFDAGNLLIDRFSFGILRYGSGIGLHYQSPVGPVNFDWGFNLYPKPGEELNHFYFSIGVI